MVNTERLCMGCMNDNGGEQICPICGYDNSIDNPKEYLKVGTWINANRYNVGKVIEESGDGVTYIGWDNDRNAIVNIKEYFPAGIAKRSADRLTVTPADNRAEAFNKGKDEFVELFKNLYLADRSLSILGVEDVFELGGTVYAVFSTVSGNTLKEYLLSNGGSLSWEKTKPMFMPLIDTVAKLNDMGIYHRGICLDNIIVGRDGKLRLTGFCIKSVLSAHSEFLSHLPSGFVAPEQYLENAQDLTGADVYSLGAVLFRTLIGTTPPDAKDRLSNDKLTIPSKITETVPKNALVAIATALKVDTTQRVGSADRLYKMFEAIAVPVSVYEEPEEEPKSKGKSGILYVIIAVLATAIILGVAFVVWVLPILKEDVASSEPTDISSAPSEIISSANSGYIPEAALYKVPNLVGEIYTDVFGEMQTEYAHFEFVIVGRMHSDTIPRGGICYQSIVADSKVERGAKIELYISQGPDKVSMPGIIGLTIEEGKNELFDAGFYSDAVIIRKGFDLSAEPGEIYKVSYASDDSAIKTGSQVSINDIIIVYYRDPATAESSEESSYTDQAAQGDEFINNN
ncbi:MAG: PASTA domain-containing protein [Clostridia bacterium]|nr:PASTA domain-containing protein [Clostridia bacterium]